VLSFCFRHSQIYSEAVRSSMINWRDLWCRVGLHRWAYAPPQAPNQFNTATANTRTCKNCARIERAIFWLGTYAGKDIIDKGRL
jgi:hypothetical protein